MDNGIDWFFNFLYVNCRLMMRNGCSTLARMLAFMYSMLMGRFVLAWMLFQGSYLAGALGDQPVHIHLGQLLALWRPLVAGIG